MPTSSPGRSKSASADVAPAGSIASGGTEYRNSAFAPKMGPVSQVGNTRQAFARLGVKPDGDADDPSSLRVHDQIARGLPARALVDMGARLAVLDMTDTLGPAFGISERTFHRWKKEPPDTPLGPEVSGRLWKFAAILAHATEVFSTQAAAETWLKTPAMALDRRRPLDLLSTPVGVEAVEELLTRLEYGVYT